METTMSAPHSTFLLELWRWFRRDRTTEPLPSDHGVDPVVGERMAKEAHIEFERKQVAKAFDRNTQANKKSS